MHAKPENRVVDDGRERALYRCSTTVSICLVSVCCRCQMRAETEGTTQNQHQARNYYSVENCCKRFADFVSTCTTMVGGGEGRETLCDFLHSRLDVHERLKFNFCR